jgi:hypothetical protein
MQSHMLPAPDESATDIATQPMAAVRRADRDRLDPLQTKQLPTTGMDSDSASVAKGGITNTLARKDFPVHPATRPVDLENNRTYGEHGSDAQSQASEQVTQAPQAEAERAASEAVSLAELERWQ